MTTPTSLVDSNYEDRGAEDHMSCDSEGDDEPEDGGSPPAAPRPPAGSWSPDSPSPVPSPVPVPVPVPVEAAVVAPAAAPGVRPRVALDLEGAFPPPPPDKCNPKLQQKVTGFLDRIQRGDVPTPVRHIRSTKNFNNPEILSEIVRQFEIVEHGTHLQATVWDPYHLPREDFVDVLQLAGGPKPQAPAASTVKSTPPKEPTTPTAVPQASGQPAVPVGPGVPKPSSTIITRKSGAASALVALPGVPHGLMVNPRGPTLADYARALQGYAAPGALR
jgi:hypothetical protein